MLCFHKRFTLYPKITEKNMTTNIIKRILSRKMLVSFVMGFGSGLPLLLTISLLQAWMKDADVDLTTIGLMSLVGLPYTLKFLWAPFFDRFTISILGRRRGWLLFNQILLCVSIVILGFSNPADNPWLLAGAAFLVSFFSASQDIVIDAYRREDLEDEELGFGSSMYIYGYRIGMLLASGGGLILADFMPFSWVYFIMAISMLPAIVTTLLTPEPAQPEGNPKSIKEAVVDPLVEYFKRDGAILILLFILLYKIGDTMAGAMTTPFYLEVGFTKSEIGAVVKLFGFWATMGGAFLGGVIMLRLGINLSLWIFGVLQMVSTAGFAVLAYVGKSIPLLSGVVAFENLSAGMGTAAFVAYMASITNKKFTATQYALLTSLMGVPRVMASAPTGYLAENFGWITFFIICTLIAIPGMIMLIKIAPLSGKKL